MKSGIVIANWIFLVAVCMLCIAGIATSLNTEWVGQATLEIIRIAGLIFLLPGILLNRRLLVMPLRDVFIEAEAERRATRSERMFLSLVMVLALLYIVITNLSWLLV